jgi:hypothetical protein
MQGLKYLCQNWGDEVCHPDVARWSHATELKEGEPIPVQPAHPIMDAICKKCENTFFVVDQMGCPKCDSTKVEKSNGAHKGPGMAWFHGYICQDCGTYFWIPERNI